MTTDSSGTPLTPLLSARNLVVNRGGVSVLNGLDIDLHPGIEVLFGVNGAGKSTLISALNGLIGAESGHIAFNGSAVTTPGEWKTLRSSIGWLPQDFGFPPTMPARDFVSYAAWLKQMPRRETPEAVDAAIASARIEHLAGRSMRSLSGGERQRAGLAAALVSRPRLLLLDEPTAGLDPVQRVHLHQLIREIASPEQGETGRHVAVLLSTHLFEDAAACMDHMSVLAGGQIAASQARSALATPSGEIGVDEIKRTVLPLLEPQ